MRSDLISHDDVSSLLHNLKGDNTTLLSHSINPLGESPIGFLGNHFLLTMKYYEEDSSSKKSATFFIKTTPQMEIHAQYVEDIGAFKKEVLLFDTLLPMLSSETTFLDRPWAPKCHIAKENFLLFDDLSIQNYTMAKLPQLFDLDHCVAVVRTLADFHAASILFEHNKATKIDQLFHEAVKEVCYVLEEGHPRNKWLKSATDACVSLCRRLGHLEESNMLPEVIENAISNVGPSSKWCNVLSHGDLWGNNFMFNYDSYGKVIHCMLIDYQLARYGPCALDLMCCLHLVAPKKLRIIHLDNLINVYHRRLSNVLKQGGLDCDLIIPFADLEEGCAHYKQIALFEALFYGTTIWIPAKLAAEVLGDPDRCMELAVGSRTALVLKCFEEDDFFKDQMTDLMEELIETMQVNGVS